MTENEDIEQNDDQYSPTGFIEIALPATALVSGGKYVYDIRKELKSSFKPDDPLIVSVLDTRTTHSNHELVVVFDNPGMHGLYIETISIKDPVSGSIFVKKHQKPENPFNVYSIAKVGWGRDQELSSDDDALPLFIPSRNSTNVRIIFKRFNADRLDKKPFGKLSLYFCVAGIAQQPKEKIVEFSVRRVEWKETT